MPSPSCIEGPAGSPVLSDLLLLVRAILGRLVGALSGVSDSETAEAARTEGPET